MTRAAAARWMAVAVFSLVSTWNYLDRLVLSAAAPQISAEFHRGLTDFGWLVAVFSISYALASPAVGWFLDWAGLELGITLGVAWWSVVTALTGFAQSFEQVALARVFLGVGEAIGIPAVGKLSAMYLEPKDRALGPAMSQVGLSIAGVAAPLLVAAFAGWRTPFLLCAALGLAWIPLWIGVRRLVPPWQTVAPRRQQEASLFGDRRLWALVAANLLWMGIYSLWSNWTTLFLRNTFHLTPQDANSYAWMPPIASTLGGFTGGWLSRRAVQRGAATIGARVSAIRICAVGCLVTIAVPLCGSPLAATGAIALSYFWVTAGSVNIYTIPVDLWGGQSAGQGISALVFAYGLLQVVISPGIGRLAEQWGFAPVCWAVAVTPLAAWGLLRRRLALPLSL